MYLKVLAPRSSHFYLHLVTHLKASSFNIQSPDQGLLRVWRDAIWSDVSIFNNSSGSQMLWMGKRLRDDSSVFDSRQRFNDSSCVNARLNPSHLLDSSTYEGGRAILMIAFLLTLRMYF